MVSRAPSTSGSKGSKGKEGEKEGKRRKESEKTRRLTDCLSLCLFLFLSFASHCVLARRFVQAPGKWTARGWDLGIPQLKAKNQYGVLLYVVVRSRKGSRAFRSDDDEACSQRYSVPVVVLVQRTVQDNSNDLDGMMILLVCSAPSRSRASCLLAVLLYPVTRKSTVTADRTSCHSLLRCMERALALLLCIPVWGRGNSRTEGQSRPPVSTHRHRYTSLDSMGQ